MILADRFWSKVDASGDCWEWAGATAKGYGHLYVGGGRADARYAPAHRVAWELLVGTIPDGLHLDHLCRNTLCVNPDHLEPVTNGENTRRGTKARRTHCIRGHRFDATNTYRDQRNRRICRACDRDRHRWAYGQEKADTDYLDERLDMTGDDA